MERDELAAWLRLLAAPGVSSSAARRLLAAFGLPQAILSQSRAALTQLLPPEQVDALLDAGSPRALEQLDATLVWLGEAREPVARWLVALGEPGYPPALLQTEDPPMLLYAMGQRPAEWPRAVAVVGSRNPTPQGAANARAFSRSFAQAGLTVVSGLALGIDAAAHEGALEGAAGDQLATIAVVGTGLDLVYPRQNLELAHRIARQGVILSEYPLGTPSLPANFPRRNRLIAALGQGTLVVEAALKSGSLITARLATEQGKDVFAIPGSIHSPQSRGCHALLKQGAKLVETAEDVLEELGPYAAGAVSAAVEPPSVSQDEKALLNALGFDPVSLDALIARTGMPAPQLQARLLELELAGRVARLPGGLFQRIAST